MIIRPKQIAQEGAAVNEVLIWDGSEWKPGAFTTAGGAPLLWGNNNILTTTTTRYLSPGFDNGNAETSPILIDAPRDGVLRNFFMRHNIPNGNGNNIVYTVRKNAGATLLAVTLASTASIGSDLVNTVNVLKGDRLDIRLTKALAIGAAPRNVIGILELV